MNIALVHELLTMRGGAERVLKILADMFPDAPIYTLLYNERKLGSWFPKERVRTSNIQCLINPLLKTKNSQLKTLLLNHHLYLPFFPQAVEQWPFDSAQGDTEKFDIVISTSSAFVHGIITNGNPKHLCYINSPARYLWDRTHDVLERAGKGPLGPLRKWYLSHIFHHLRIWDSEAADRPDKLLASSREVQRRIELYWRRESDVVYPPIEDFWLRNGQRTEDRGQRNYYLVVSTLSPYKRIDLAIEACNALNIPLKIAGEGPERKQLQKLAGPTIEFLGFQGNEELKELYSNAKATFFPGEEDFGLVPLESMACGTPVIAYRGGGALETILEGKTGEFFSEATFQSLQETIERFEKNAYDPEVCRTQASQFSRQRFETEILKNISALLHS